MNFPYIKQIHVNNCFTYKDFDIPANSLSDFKHIIITGKNGTGKTTILSRIAYQINEYRVNERDKIGGIRYLNALIAANKTNSNVSKWKEQIEEYKDLDLLFLRDSNPDDLFNGNNYVFSFFKAHRRVELQEVKSVTTENIFLNQLDKKSNPEQFASQFKQYLVNKKVYEAFDYMEERLDNLNQNKIFFDRLTSSLQRIFQDKGLQLLFSQGNFEFYIQFGDLRKITFNQMSEGFSAFVSILMDLFMRVDLIRRNRDDFNYNPFGIVLIDEPETHFHIEMQYEILPLLTELFPNIQFIIATHSPAIISSIKDSVVFDLSSRKEIQGWQVGSSYSELMIKHFGLDNEFSPIADKILLDLNLAVQEKNPILLKKILVDNEQIMTPSLKFEIESQISLIENKLGLK